MRHSSNYVVGKFHNFHHLHFKVRIHSSFQNGILHLEIQMQSDTDSVCKRINRCVKQAISNADITDHYITISFRNRFQASESIGFVSLERKAFLWHGIKCLTFLSVLIKKSRWEQSRFFCSARRLHFIQNIVEKLLKVHNYTKATQLTNKHELQTKYMHVDTVTYCYLFYLQQQHKILNNVFKRIAIQ